MLHTKINKHFYYLIHSKHYCQVILLTLLPTMQIFTECCRHMSCFPPTRTAVLLMIPILKKWERI